MASVIGGPNAADAAPRVWQETPRRRDLVGSLRRTLAEAPRKWLPSFGLTTAFQIYREDWKTTLSSDVGAGIVVAVMLIPQALAYALLTGMPAVTGFFAAILSVFAYPVFGSSGHQAVGPVALMSLMARDAIEAVVADAPAAAGGAEAVARYGQLAARLAFLVGVLQAGMGLLRGGYIINLLSHSVLAGFTASSAIIIASSQLGKALGFSIPNHDYVWETWRDVILKLDKTHGLSVGIFFANMVAFWALTKVRQRLLASPAVRSRALVLATLRVLSPALLIVTVNILVAWGARLDKLGLKVLGTIPTGLPPWDPGLVFGAGVAGGGSFGDDAKALLGSAALIALVSYVESASVAKAMQAKYGIPPGGRPVDGNQELLGLGGACILSSMGHGFPTTGGFSRSGVQAEAGSRTVATGLVAGSVLMIVVSFATGLFRYLPDTCLAAMITFSALRLLETATPRYLWVVDKPDFAVYVVTLAVTIGGGIEAGLMAGAALSLLRLLQEAASPHTAVLGVMPDGVTYRNVARFPDLAKPVPGIVVVRFDGPIFFANTGVLTDRVLSAVTAAWEQPKAQAAASAAAEPLAAAVREVELVPTAAPASTLAPAPSQPLGLQAVVLDLSGVSSIDSAGVHALLDTIPAELKRAAARHGKRVAAAAAASSASKGGLPTVAPVAPRVFLAGVHGPVRDRLQAGEAAHAAAHANSHAGSRRSWCRSLAATHGHGAAAQPATTVVSAAAASAPGAEPSTAVAVQPDPAATQPVAADDDARPATQALTSASTSGGAPFLRRTAALPSPGASDTDASGVDDSATPLAAAVDGVDAAVDVAGAPAWPGLSSLVVAHREHAPALLRQVDVAQAVAAVRALLAEEGGAVPAVDASLHHRDH